MVSTTDRLGKLEGDVRRCKVLMFGLIGAVGVAFLLGAAGSQFVDGEGYRVVDKNGNRRGAFFVSGDGSATLMLRADDGSELMLDPYGLTVSDSNGHTRISLSLESPAALRALRRDGHDTTAKATLTFANAKGQMNYYIPRSEKPLRSLPKRPR